jgi:hypothetical protein
MRSLVEVVYEAGITINTVEANDDVPYVIIESDSGLTLEGFKQYRVSLIKPDHSLINSVCILFCVYLYLKSKFEKPLFS